MREWLAFGMLMNVVAALDLTGVDADWARMMCPVSQTDLAALAADAVGKEARTKETRAGRSALAGPGFFFGPSEVSEC